jgi:hypothetical protein
MKTLSNSKSKKVKCLSGIDKALYELGIKLTVKKAKS